MRRRRVVRRAGIKFAMSLLDHTEASSSADLPSIGGYSRSNGNDSHNDDGGRASSPVEPERKLGKLMRGVGLGQQLVTRIPQSSLHDSGVLLADQHVVSVMGGDGEDRHSILRERIDD
jgi:hypothetical protein